MATPSAENPPLVLEPLRTHHTQWEGIVHLTYADYVDDSRYPITHVRSFGTPATIAIATFLDSRPEMDEELGRLYDGMMGSYHAYMNIHRAAVRTWAHEAHDPQAFLWQFQRADVLAALVYLQIDKLLTNMTRLRNHIPFEQADAVCLRIHEPEHIPLVRYMVDLGCDPHLPDMETFTRETVGGYTQKCDSVIGAQLLGPLSMAEAVYVADRAVGKVVV